jgi:hypothetical protein
MRKGKFRNNQIIFGFYIIAIEASFYFDDDHLLLREGITVADESPLLLVRKI